MSESVCVHACVRACFCMITQKENDQGMTMKLEYIVAYENSSDKFDIEHHRMKVKVIVGLQNFPCLPQYKLSSPITSLWYKLGSLYY